MIWAEFLNSLQPKCEFKFNYFLKLDTLLKSANIINIFII